MNKLKKYGLSQRFINEATMYPDLVIGRVVSQYSELYRVVTEDDELLASVSGRYRYDATHIADFPVVGDFVMLDRSTDEQGNGIIHHTLTRKTAFGRTAVGGKDEVQVVASNIDLVFICMSMNNDFNIRRMERYLSVAWDSGATPIVILTKADLCEDNLSIVDRVQTAAIGVDILITSSLDGTACAKILPYMHQGITASFIGSSGVGKSTLINCLMGQDMLSTFTIRKDDKGRHTTTRRELLVLPDGGSVIDTPGMRELGVESVDLAKTFSDIDALICKCKFSDCAHSGEPGCAIQAAIDEGKLDAGRLVSYLKLKKEAKYDGLNSKQIETEKMNTMFADFGGIKNAKKFIKSKHKRK